MQKVRSDTEVWQEILGQATVLHGAMPETLRNPPKSAVGLSRVPITRKQWVKALGGGELDGVWLPRVPSSYRMVGKETGELDEYGNPMVRRRLDMSATLARGFDWEYLTDVIAANYVQAVRMRLHFTNKAAMNAAVHHLHYWTTCPKKLYKPLGKVLGWISEIKADLWLGMSEEELRNAVGERCRPILVRNKALRREFHAELVSAIQKRTDYEGQLECIRELLEDPRWSMFTLEGAVRYLRQAKSCYKWTRRDAAEAIYGDGKCTIASPRENPRERAERIGKAVAEARVAGKSLRVALGENDYRWYKRNRGKFRICGLPPRNVNKNWGTKI